MKKIKFLTMAAIAIFTVSACEKADNTNQSSGNDSDQTEASGNVSGVWKAGSVIEVDGHITVPAGESLTIEEGVTVIFNSAGVGVNHVPIEFTVDGCLYCLGTEAQPILFSVPEAERTEANIFAGLWGGIVATGNCDEMVLDHVIIEYTGGQVIEGSPAAENGIYTAGDDAYPHVTTNNINGKYVITNSILRYGWSDGIYLMGGQAIIAGNVFAGTGYDGAEAVNVKAGCTVDIAGNVMFSPNTNGMKLSSSGQSETRGQAKVQAYNNTIVNSGWRRDGEKGGCIYVEKNALANVFNNLIVNCKFRAMTPNYTIPDNPEEGYDDSSVIDWNWYTSGSQKSSIVYEDESGVAYAWEGYNYEHENYNPAVDTHSIVATEADGRDPQFENFDISATPLTGTVYDMTWDFHLKAGSAALSGANPGTDAALQPYFGQNGLSVNGKTYNSPAVASYFGALGTK